MKTIQKYVSGVLIMMMSVGLMSTLSQTAFADSYYSCQIEIQSYETSENSISVKLQNYSNSNCSYNNSYQSTFDRTFRIEFTQDGSSSYQYSNNNYDYSGNKTNVRFGDIVRFDRLSSGTTYRFIAYETTPANQNCYRDSYGYSVCPSVSSTTEVARTSISTRAYNNYNNSNQNYYYGYNGGSYDYHQLVLDNDYQDSSFYRTLRKGSRGDDVRYLQNLLSDAGYYDRSITGRFDTYTYTAVRNFQRDNGLRRDGVVGYNTQSLLEDSQNDTNYSNNTYYYR